MQQKYSLVFLLTGGWGGGCKGDLLGLPKTWCSSSAWCPQSTPPSTRTPNTPAEEGALPTDKRGFFCPDQKTREARQKPMGFPPPQLPLIWSIESERAVHSSNPHFGGLKPPQPQPQPSSSLSAPSLVLPAPQKPHTPHPAPCTPLPGLITQDCGKIPR